MAIALVSGPSDISEIRAVLNNLINQLNSGPLEFGGNLEVDGTLTVDGASTLTGAVAIGSTLGVTGVLTPTGGVAAGGGFTIAPNLVHTGAWKPLAITDGSENTASVTETYIAQVFVPANCTVTGVAVVNATAVAGNITVALADSTGAPIAAAKSASTAASGTAAYQRVDFAAPYAAKGPATYYVMLQSNNTGYKFRTHTVGDFRTTKQTAQTYGTLTSFTVPTTFTTAVGPVASLY